MLREFNKLNIRRLFWKFGIKTVVVEITQNADVFQNIYFKERNNMAVGKALRVIINFYKTQCRAVIKWKKKHSSKQAVSITYTLEN